MKKVYTSLVMFFLVVSGCSGLKMDMAPPSQRFTVGTGAEVNCVTDNRTGLMWMRDGNLPDRSWYNALDYADEVNGGPGLCGHNDWRLPRVHELRSLINPNQPSTANWLNTQGFRNVKKYYYWSSDTNGVGSGEAWIVYMLDGLEAYFSMSNSYSVLLVRTK